LRLVVAHLGSGCSVTAVEAGRSVDTSMGMTPLEGLMMGTRAGSIDPGVILAALDQDRLTPDQLADALDHRSGLLGVSGRSSDVRELLRAETEGDSDASLALELFVRRAAAGIAASATALPEVDAIVFTGGIGANSGPIRARIVGRLAVLGVRQISFGNVELDARLSGPGNQPAIVRVMAREDVVIARAAASVLTG
jgi:acetate kinase